jgi:hypothetical protein
MKQYWEFSSKIYSTEFFSALPLCFWLNEKVIRVYFSSRNSRNESIPYYFDYDFEDKKTITEPCSIGLNLGELGTFDDSGIMPSSLIKVGEKIFMYYIGWNLGVTVPFRNSIGLAISNDNGQTFERQYKGPIIDRNKDEPHFVASNHVIYHEGIFKMWYLSCVKWHKTNDKIKHYYHIKYATSIDGINWERNNIVAIDFQYENEYAISVPRVLIEDGIYKMWYSYRGGPKSEQYRIGYAESTDGINWMRKDYVINFMLSGDNWDSEMACYPFVFKYKNSTYMLYNGNNYGRTGIGMAKLIL